MKEAMFYYKLGDQKVKCDLCAHRCTIFPLQRGICQVRRNLGGTLYSLVYGKLSACHIDPIEKKPLFHFFPGARTLSFSTVGCNFRCRFCQNWDISQYPKELGGVTGEDFPPERLVALSLENNCAILAYTYSEPTIFFEYAYDTARIARDRGLKNIFVSNGYMTAEALEAISPYLDAINVDLKAFSPVTYRKVMGGLFEHVLETLRRLRDYKTIWLEVTSLIIPTVNDGDEELREMARFVLSLGEGTPWHVTRFHPDYKMIHLPPTPSETLRRAREIGLDEGLKYVYAGNLLSDLGENTFCYNCGELLIERRGFEVAANHLRGSRCPSCFAAIDGVGLDWKLLAAA